MDGRRWGRVCGLVWRSERCRWRNFGPLFANFLYLRPRLPYQDNVNIMASIEAAPAQYKQPSRKGKKAWRKNVDVTEIQSGLEEVRTEIIQG